MDRSRQIGSSPEAGAGYHSMPSPSGKQDFSGNATPVNRRSDQFQEVHYMLEMALSHANVKITHLQIWDVRNPALISSFDHHQRRSPGQPTLTSWVDVDSLDVHNSEERIAGRGFTLGPGEDSMVFSTGVIRITKPPEDGRSSPLNRFLLSQVFTGRSYPKVDPNGKNIIPPGYDSLYVYDSEALESSRSAADYSHDYIVRDLSQVLPQFVVHFTVAAVTDGDRARNTKAKEAHHSAQGTDVMGDILDLLDRKLHWSQESVRNKFHAINALQSELSQASDEYNRSLDASHQSDERLQACRELLAQRRSVINDKLAEIQNNSKLVEESLYAMLQDALFSLQDETQRKLNILLGEELEIRRRLAHIDWAEGCLSRFRSELGPPDFVHAWRNHRTVRKSLYKYRDIGASVLDRVHADLKVVGGVRIVTERGPTSAALNSTSGNDQLVSNQKSLAEIALIAEDGSTEFRRDIFRTSSPLKNGSQAKSQPSSQPGASVINDFTRGTNSLTQSFQADIKGGKMKDTLAPNSYAATPTIPALGLPSTSTRFSGGIGDNALKSTVDKFSTGDTHEEWLRVMRQNEGLPDPKPAETQNFDGNQSVQDSYLSLTGASTEVSENHNSSRFQAVDSFVANAMSTGDNTGEENGPMSPSSTSVPASPPALPASEFGGDLPPPPPSGESSLQEGEEAAEDLQNDEADTFGPDNVIPTGPLAKYWRRHSLTRLKQQLRRNLESLPHLDSDIAITSNDRALILASLPKPVSMQMRRVELDPSCRSVEDFQEALINHVDGEEGMLLLCQSGDYKFGAYAECLFDIRTDEGENENEQGHQYIVDSHYGTRKNYLFSLTHDLKVSH